MGEGWPVLRFVDAPEVTANVRYDLNAGPSAPLAEGWSLGAPTLEGDPDAIGVEWGRRLISFDQLIHGDRGRALAHLNALRREVYRRSNWLLIQLGPSSAPVWLRTYRSASGDLDFEQVYNDGRPDHWRLGVQLRADPWAIGERVSFDLESSPIPFRDRASGPWLIAQRMGVWLPPILGEAPTPLRVTHYGYSSTAPPAGTYTTTRDGFLMCSPAVDQSAQSLRHWVVNAAGSAVVYKGAAPGPMHPGRYRVVVAHTSMASFTEGFRFGVSYDGGTSAVWTKPAATSANGRTMATVGSKTYWWHDLGEITIRSSDGGPVTPYLWLTWNGTAGAWISTTLIPVAQDAVGEEATVIDMLSAAPEFGTPLRDVLVVDDSDDHDHQAVRDDLPLPALARGASQLIAHPQHENRLTLLSQMGTVADTGTVGSLGEAAGARISYRPRYTDLAGDA